MTTWGTRSGEALAPFLLAQAAAGAAGGSSGDGFLVASLILGGIGILLLALEVVIPTSGMLAIVCGVAFLGSIVAMFLWSVTAGFALMAIYAFAAPFLLILLLKLWARSPIARRAVLDSGPVKLVTANPVPGAEMDPDDPEAVVAANDQARLRRAREMAAFIGRRGVAVTPLRPSGFVQLDGQRVDAVAETGLIDPGMPVRVVAILDGALKVRPDA
jgi:membrane-bound serine protease (ClpP class)